MNNLTIPLMPILTLLIYSADADTTSRRAMITGARGPGRCVIEVNVDGAARIEIFGDTANLTTESGEAAYWRRFECNMPVPRGPVDFHLGRISGRGSVRLLQSTRNKGGTALIHISDPQKSRGTYAVDLLWEIPGRWRPPSSQPWPDGGGLGSLPAARASRACQDAVTRQLSQDGLAYVKFESTIPRDNPGRKDRITGSATGRRGPSVQRFQYSCSVDFVTGAVWSVDVHRW
jgi:hypothetical protein